MKQRHKVPAAEVANVRRRRRKINETTLYIQRGRMHGRVMASGVQDEGTLVSRTELMLGGQRGLGDISGLVASATVEFSWIPKF